MAPAATDATATRTERRASDTIEKDIECIRKRDETTAPSCPRTAPRDSHPSHERPATLRTCGALACRFRPVLDLAILVDDTRLVGAEGPRTGHARVDRHGP